MTSHPTQLATCVSVRADRLTCLAALSIALAGCTNFGGSLEGRLPSPEPRDVAHAESADADQWSSWRGGGHHGVSPCTSVPVDFSARRNVQWKTPLAGEGNSSPVVVGGKVYITRSQGEGHRTQLEIVAIDRHSGNELWTKSVGRPVGNTHQRNGFASATVASDGEHVLAYFGAKGLYCLTTDGDLRWHRPYTGAIHEWGTASSPVIAGGMAIQLVESQSESFLAAYDLATGDQQWQTPRESNGCWTSPVVTSIGSRWHVVVNGSGSSNGLSGSITGYDLANGQLLWSIEGTSDIVCPTAAVGQDTIVSATGASGRVLALDTRQSPPTVKWQLPSGGAYVPTGVVYRDRVYLVDDDGILRCLNLEDGTSIWKKRLGSPVSASLIAAAGRIYVATESGEVLVVSATDEFQMLAKNKLGERILATPAIASDELFIRGQSHLFCISNEVRAAQRPDVEEDATSETALSPSDAVFTSDDQAGS